MEKTCTRCKRSQPITEFYLRGGCESSGELRRRSQCRDCMYEKKGHSRRTRMSDDERRANHRQSYMKRRHNVSATEYEAMLEAQGGVCLACGGNPGPRALHIDHDHNCCPKLPACGECVRGLLCLPCNVQLGILESVEKVYRLGDYLARFGQSLPTYRPI